MSTERRVDVDDLTLAWGDATAWKSRLREESAKSWLQRPIAERLRIALEMIRSPARQTGTPSTEGPDHERVG